MDQLRSAISAEFNATIDELRSEILTLRNTVNVLQERQVQDRTFQEQRPTPRPKPSLPDPEKFTGNSIKFDTWDAAIRAKLHIDGLAIGDATAQFYYVYLNLDSKVQAMVLPQLAHAKQSGTHDYNTILDQLTRVYDNPNKVQEAEDRLLSLKQDTDPLAAYIAKFERNLYEANGQDWPDVAKISAFRKGLNTTLRNRLNQQLNLPRIYPDFLRVVQQLASYSIGSGNGSGQHSKPASTNPTHNYANRNDADRMDMSALQLNLIAMEADAEETDAGLKNLSTVYR
jgi:hypothetical protein